MKKLLLAILILTPIINATPKEKSKIDTWLDTVRFESFKSIKDQHEAFPWINIKDKRDNTALHWAALYRSPHVIKYLINKGAIVDAVNAEGQTPLHLAALNKYPRKVKMLLAKKANWQTRNDDGKKPIELATGPVRELLEAHTECKICLAEIPFFELTRTKCTHTYCTNCLDQWLAQELQNGKPGTCPICRRVLIRNNNYIPQGYNNDPNPVNQAMEVFWALHLFIGAMYNLDT